MCIAKILRILRVCVPLNETLLTGLANIITVADLVNIIMLCIGSASMDLIICGWWACGWQTNLCLVDQWLAVLQRGPFAHGQKSPVQTRSNFWSCSEGFCRSWEAVCGAQVNNYRSVHPIQISLSMEFSIYKGIPTRGSWNGTPPNIKGPLYFL